MKIGELSRITGASVRSLRYYEERQLLLSHRTSGGQRIYDQDAVERVTLIRDLFAAGVGSDAIVQLLPCIHSGTATPAMVERLTQERARIDTEIQRLAATRDRLDEYIVVTRAATPPAASAG
jgi:DNA-binding transcriptional MerR regulator